MLRDTMNEKVQYNSVAESVYAKLTMAIKDPFKSAPPCRILGLNDKDLELFAKVCQPFHAEENVLFIRDYIEAPFTTNKSGYQHLYDMYIKNDAKLKVNIDDSLREDLEKFVTTNGQLDMQTNTGSILKAYKKIYEAVAYLVYSDVVLKKAAGSLFEKLKNAEQGLHTNLTVSNQKR